MYVLAVASFGAAVFGAYMVGEYVGRESERVAQRRRREWQYRLDNETR